MIQVEFDDVTMTQALIAIVAVVIYLTTLFWGVLNYLEVKQLMKMLTIYRNSYTRMLKNMKGVDLMREQLVMMEDPDHFDDEQFTAEMEQQIQQALDLVDKERGQR